MMKSKIGVLTKTFLKTSFQSFYSKNVSSNNKRGKMAIIAYIILFAYLIGVFAYLSYGMITSLQSISQETVFLGLLFCMIAFMLLFQSVFSVLNLLYWSKDLEYTLPLPIKTSEFLIAKLNVLLITEYITELLFGLIPLIVYGVLTSAGALYYIAVILCLMVFPILPILIAGLLVMIVMSFAKLSKNRGRFQLVATIILVIVMLFFQYNIMQTTNGEISEQQVAEKLVQANGLVEIVENYFITLKPMVQVLTTNQIGIMVLELLKVIGITAVAYLVFLLIGQKLYLKGAVGSSVGGNSHRKKVKESEIGKSQKIGIAYVKKEFKILFRNPIYLMQCILPAMLMPVLFFFIFTMAMPQPEGEDLAQLQQMLAPGNIYTIGTVCLVLGIVQFFSMIIYIAVTAISRDGQNAIFMKYIPVSLYQQFKYKAIPNIIAIMISAVLVMGVVWYYTKANVLFLGIIFVIAFVIAIFESYLMVMVDLRKPKLQWDSEYAVVKQNMNLAWTMAASGIVILFLIVFSSIGQFVDYRIAMGILFILMSVVAYLVDRYVYAHQDKLFEKII